MNAVRQRPLLKNLDHFKSGCNCLRAFALRLAQDFSLTPGFSPVLIEPPSASRFNGFPPRDKPLKRLNLSRLTGAGLKSGVNESSPNFPENIIAAKEHKDAFTTKKPSNQELGSFVTWLFQSLRSLRSFAAKVSLKKL